MSRRRGEFEHRTSIFEGAFRAWSHLGGLEPLDLETKSTSDLDPLNFPLENDPRLAAQKTKGNKKKNENGGGGGEDDFDSSGGGGGDDKKGRREYPYEPLPRSGLAHPFVQAILSPWLGPDADQDAIQLGLTTLRTWWQHRRKGESGSAIVALGTDKMRGVVEGYTRHFFNLAHCLIVNDKEQPPRTLQGKMRDLEKSRNKKGTKKRSREDESIKVAAMAFQSGFGPGLPNVPQQQPGGGGGGMMNNNQNQNDGMNNMNPLERLHAAQRRQLAESGGVTNLGGGTGLPDHTGNAPGPLQMKNSCNPAKVDLPGLVQHVSSSAAQLAYRGTSDENSKPSYLSNIDPSKYGDPSITPLVVASPNPRTGKTDLQFCMSIDGITCAHCVKIVETVLRGCNGSRSPIDGLVDAAADMELRIVVIKVADMTQCRRIAHEAARNLSMVGYTAKARSVTVPGDMTLGNMYGIMERTIPSLSPMMGFNWTFDCGCPDNNVLRMDCPRHSQFGPGILEAFNKTEHLLSKFISGCSKKTGMPCTAGVHCHCRANRNSPVPSASIPGMADQQQQQLQQQHSPQPQSSNPYHDNNGQNTNNKNEYLSYQQPIQDGAPMGGGNDDGGDGPSRRGARSSMRMSIGGLGGLGRHLSLTSETTFGRAMSGLSALSIDWENMDDFDVNVDHSAGINNDIINSQQQQQQGQNNGLQGDGSPQQQQLAGADGAGGYGQQQQHPNGQRVARRSSLRKNLPVNSNGNMFNVSFNM